MLPSFGLLASSRPYPSDHSGKRDGLRSVVPAQRKSEPQASWQPGSGEPQLLQRPFPARKTVPVHQGPPTAAFRPPPENFKP
jgi:hypothetical protein